jgi:A/G-specific adenine glycosylase
LLRWAESHQRDLPWKGIRDPYKIWLSEIILQQTRVNQGMSYYHKFVSLFPTVHDLAQASEDEVLKCWEGLGYYSRARNLYLTAKYVSKTLKGIFPNSYQELLTLKGVGPYTAAAIASFAFEEKKAVIDGNVKRLVSRILGITDPVESSKVKNLLDNFTNQAIQEVAPSLFNQALMDHGATVCKPKSPLCDQCVFKTYCKAFQQNQVNIIPVKADKVVQTTRTFHFLDFVLPENMTILQKRSGQDIWKGLYQLPAIELDEIEWNLIKSKIEESYSLKNMSLQIIKVNEFPLKQKLTHRIILGTFYKVILDKVPDKIKEDQYLVKRSEISNFAFPKIIADYYKSDI